MILVYVGEMDKKCYVNENWDETEYKKEMDEAEEAINIAVSILKQSSVCGILKLNNEKYNIKGVC